jgi:SulP family sulfate permease
VIFSTQIKDALGLNIEKLPSEFFHKWLTYFSNIDDTNLYALSITIVTILITVYSKKVTTKIPGSFIAIIGITLFVQIASIPVTTIETFFGEIPNTFALQFPTIELSTLYIYIAPALTIALLGGVESLLSAVVSDGMIGDNHRSNTELIAQGVANMVTPFFGGIAATGAIARTATNVKNGGRTPIAGIVHSFTLLLIMLIFASYAKLIPMSALAGILIVVSYNMSEWRSFILILRGSSFDVIILLSTFLLTVFVDLTIAIQIGVVLSSLLFMKKMADISTKSTYQVDSDVLEDYSEVPEGISIYEISGPLFFASAKQYSEIIKDIGLNSKIIIIRMRHVPFVDSTALHNLQQMIKILQKSNVEIVLSGVQNSVLKDLKKDGMTTLIGEENILDSFSKALRHAKELIVTLP